MCRGAHACLISTACMSTHHKQAVPMKVRRGCQVLYTGPKTACKQVYVCWESNRSLLQEQPVLLATEPTLQTKKGKLSTRKVSQFQSQT